MRVVLSEIAEAGLRNLNVEPERSDALRLSILHFLSNTAAAIEKSQRLLGPDHQNVLLYQLSFFRVTWEPGDPSLVWSIGWLGQYDPDRN